MLTKILCSLLFVVAVLGKNPVDADDSLLKSIAEAKGSELYPSRNLQQQERFVFVDPPWWVRIEDTFEGVNLKRCSRRAVPPEDGTKCAPRPKTCFFGTQDCAGVQHPTTQCFCDSRSGSQTWKCAVEQCPAPAEEILPAPPVVGGGSLSEIVLSDVAADLTTAIYRVTLVNSWTPENHPVNYPTNSAHWTPPVLASHNQQYSMWANGASASPGVQLVAEIGGTSILTDELSAAGSNVFDVELGINQFTADDPQVLSVEFDPSHQYLSAVSMIAPSPDWFSGFYDLHPVTSGNYWQSFRIASYPWDAGTENGETYSLSNSATVPQQLISEITTATAPATGVFLNSGQVLPVITWEFELIN